MKKILFFICQFLIISSSISAQKYEAVIVKAGIRIVDVIPFNERYRYPEFIPGRIFITNGLYRDAKMNLNFLNGEMEYLIDRDTLIITNKRDLEIITVAQDTFYFDKNYLEQISTGPVKVAMKEYIKVKEKQKQDSYGTASSGSASTSYGSLPAQGNFFKLSSNTDLYLQRTLEFYLSDKKGGFVPFTKKNLLRLYPKQKDDIKAYLKSDKIKYDDRDDILKLAEFVGTL
jgi:hypothetical protein